MKGARRGQDNLDIQQVRSRDTAKKYNIARRAIKMLKTHSFAVVIDFFIYVYFQKTCGMVRFSGFASAVACSLPT